MDHSPPPRCSQQACATTRISVAEMERYHHLLGLCRETAGLQSTYVAATETFAFVVFRRVRMQLLSLETQRKTNHFGFTRVRVWTTFSRRVRQSLL